MSTPARVGVFVVALLAVFGLAFGVGRVADPDTAPAESHDTHDISAEDAHGDHAADRAESLHLVPATRQLSPGAEVSMSFQIQDGDGDPLTSYDVKHEKQLHLIVLGTQNLTDFQHVHPVLGADGTWTTSLSLAHGTSYRLYADGSTGGSDFLASADVFTTGGSPPSGTVPAPAPAAATVDTVDGFTVTLEQGHGTARFQVARGGTPAEVEPYLGALGHLVVIRVGDLAYLHVHPEETDAPVFAVSGLAPGRYRCFFDFQVDGVVRTAAFTVDVGTDMQPEEGDDEHSH